MLERSSLFTVLMVLCGSCAWGQSLGLRPPTPEERAWADAHMTRVKQVLPNRLALARAAAEHARRGNREALRGLETVAVAEDGQEFLGSTAAGNHSLAPVLVKAAPSVTLVCPSAVDNSTEAWFPPIGSQIAGSCASFSTAYYTMTSQVARLRGWDVTQDPAGAHTFSTKFIYNQINGGGDNGSNQFGAYQVMLNDGCATLQDLPYDNDILAWPTTAATWRNAINYRMAACGTIGALDTSAGLANAKQMLANGYILNYSTCITGWQTSTLSNDPGTSADDWLFAAGAPAARRVVAVTVVGAVNHGMTIVGYDDDVWVDLNGNGAVDAGEKGAFRIANSWGNWNDAGFMWVAYDAIRAVSAVAGGPAPANRESIFYNQEAYWISARPAYTPSLVAEVSLASAARNQLSLQIGLGAAGATTPSAVWSPGSLQYKGGPLAFDGTATSLPATFVFDCTDLVGGSGTRWFASLRDSSAGSPASLLALRFIDAGNVATAAQGTNPAGGLPRDVDGGILYAYADNVLASNVAPVALGQTLRILQGTSRPVTLTASDPNADTLTWTVVKPPAHGALSGTAPALVYTPSPSFQGTDDFTFKASDGKADSAVAAVVIHVGLAGPGLLAEFFQTGSLSLLPDLTGRTADFSRIDARINYAADADYPAGFSTNFASRHTGYLDIAAAGSYTLYLSSDDGSRLWLDDAALIGNDGSHGMTERSATLTLAAGRHPLRVEYFQGGGGKGLILSWAGPGIAKAVIPAGAFVYPATTNTAPVAQDRTLSAGKNTLTAVGLLATDADEDRLSYAVQTQPAHGTLFGTAPDLLYLAVPGYLGTDQFTFLANDGTADSNTATVHLTVVPVNHAPVAAGQDLTAVKDQPARVVLGATDADGDALAFTVLTQPAHGTLSGTAPALVYTPSLGFTGVDAFSFKAGDGHLDSAPASVRIHVGSAGPGLLAEYFHIGGLSAIPSLAGLHPETTLVVPQINYTVPADFPATMTTDFVSRHTGFLNIATAGSYTLYLNSDDGSRLYVDGALLVNDDGPHGMTERSAAVTLTAGYHALRVEYYQGGGGYGLVLSWAGPGISKAPVPAGALVNVAVANTAPTAQDQTLVTSLNTARPITLAATDAEGDPLVYTLVTRPAYGVLTGTAPDLVYQPANGFQGQDPFTFRVNDGRTDSNLATVSITVNGAAVAPAITAQPRNLTVAAGQTATFTVTATGTGPLAYQWSRNGAAIPGATGPSYTTAATTAADSGATFTVKVTNAQGNVTSQTATLTIIKSLDLNGDNAVNVLDLAILAARYGHADATADLDTSGTVDDADILLLLGGI